MEFKSMVLVILHSFKPQALLDFEERQGSAVAQGKLSNSDINRLPIKTFDPEHAAGKTQ